MRVCVCTHTHTCIYECICIHVFMYIYIYGDERLDFTTVPLNFTTDFTDSAFYCIQMGCSRKLGGRQRRVTLLTILLLTLLTLLTLLHTKGVLEETRGETATSYSTLSEITPAYAPHTLLRIRSAYAAHTGDSDELLNFIGLGGGGGGYCHR
jgi:hypothetical protein